MSDEEDDDNSNDRSEEDEDEDSSDGEGSDNEEESMSDDIQNIALIKEVQVKSDVELLIELSTYMDRVKRRISRQLQLERLSAERSRPPPLPPEPYNHHDINTTDKDDDSVSSWSSPSRPYMWQEYDQMNESDREGLLEKAILILGENGNAELSTRERKPKYHKSAKANGNRL